MRQNTDDDQQPSRMCAGDRGPSVSRGPAHDERRAAIANTLTRWEPFAELADIRTRDGVLEVKLPLPKAAAKEPVKITPSTGS